MSALHADPVVVHYFDTAVHHIACGVPGFDRSTKHARAVSCKACIALIRHPAAEHAEPADAAGQAH